MKTYTCLSKSFFAISFAIVFFSLTAYAQTFSSATGDISVPHGPNEPLCTAPGAYVCKTVLVSGLPGNAILRSATVGLIDDVNVGSLDVQVRGPGGVPTFMPVSRTGATSASSCGDDTDIEGEFTFQDSSIGNFWGTAAALTSTEIMPTGTYFPSFPGGGPAPPAGTPNNVMSTTFSGTTNGSWNVCVRDWGDNGGTRLQIARLTFAVPTAASAAIGGQVLTNSGSGIRNAVVTISGGNLPQPLTTKTTSFGYYSFSGIPVGGTYIVTVSAKRYAFNNPSQVLNVQDDIADANFVAEND
jgi:Carboxypeptidase regulatory-like domain